MQKCSHCGGAGKCDCFECKSAIFDGDLFDRDDLRDEDDLRIAAVEAAEKVSGAVHCEVCEGTGRDDECRDDDGECLHCQGTGKCSCFQCRARFAQYKMAGMELIEWASKGSNAVHCKVCEGKGFTGDRPSGGTSGPDGSGESGGFRDVE